MRREGVEVYHYLDDLLIVARERSTLLHHVALVRNTLTRFGWLVNEAKSQPEPSQTIIYLGALFNTRIGMVSLPQQKILMLSRRAEQLMFTSVLSARKYMAFLGLLTSTLGLVKWARWRMRPFQSFFLSHWNCYLQDWSQMIPLSWKVKRHLLWWQSPSNLRRGYPLAEPEWVEVFTDASGQGWGAHVEEMAIQGQWRSDLSHLPSNVLELRAIREALEVLRPVLSGTSVKIRSDNMSAVSYIRKQGGTGSSRLMREVSPIMNWAQSIFQWITSLWGLPHIDLMASEKNYKIKHFFSRVPSARAVGIDAFSQNWRNLWAYIFPPFPIIFKVLRKILVSHMDVIAIIPDWPRRPWYPLLRRLCICQPLRLPFDGGSLNAGPVSSSESQQSQSCGMEVEKSRLRRRGCSDQVINTLLKARRPGTSNTYHRIWQRFLSWAREKNLDPLQPSTPMILEFLQAGLDYGLSLSSLKVQISALSAVLGERWAEDPLIEQFFKAVLRVKPPVKKSSPPWDLPLVLQALSAAPFEPIDQIPLWWLSLKTVFLVAVTSARRVGELQALSVDQPYTIFHEEKVVLRTVPSFLPKVLSRFHVNEPIILPTLPVENGQSSLDVRRCLQVYIDRTKSLRKSQRLFVVPAGSRKGEAAAKSTLSSWIVKTILQAYKEQGRSSPRAVRAHSTRSIAASWAVEAGVSVESICRAATWASTNTFIKHYKLDVLSAADAQFGQSVLSVSQK
ncbi:hypothetical protein XENTR_v10021466 [Xenopus tropicalis]|nr:hypothetical protein XENTR_v10021466 [Xenopus tropicalis]